MPPDLVAVHAAFAGPADVVAERRSLYRLAAELAGAAQPVPDDVLDSPLVRYRLGGALSGQVDLRHRDLAVDRDAVGKTAYVGVPVVVDPAAQVALADLLRIIGPVEGLRLVTMTDDVLDVIRSGVRLVREVGGALADDLLAHVDLLAVVDPETTGGLVSASSRYFPGIVVIERPSTAFEVAEALIHEGAHEKFFDLAITRRFFDVNSDRVEDFTPSWSRAKWPFEQVFAAWHAYLCLAQFARDADGVPVGPGSLLPLAAERAVEIGKWLRDHEASLLVDARWMVDALHVDGLAAPVIESSPPVPVEPAGVFVVNPHVRSGAAALPTGRRAAGWSGPPIEMFWLECDSAAVLDLFAEQVEGLSVEDAVVAASASWNVDVGAGLARFSAVFRSLVADRLVVPASS